MKMKISKFKVLSIIGVSLIIAFMCASVACNKSSNVNDETTYINHDLNKDLSISKDLEAVYKNLDYNFAQDFAQELATNPDIADFMLWRTAGSDGEHKAADFLVDQMKQLGLSSVEKVGVPCDKFQFNYSNLKIANTDINITPGVFQLNGTNGDLTTKIVDCGQGNEKDYANIDVAGKIALVEVDMYNDAWVDLYIHQAKEAGAVAFVCWTETGYALDNPEGANVQDVCCDDIMPACSINANDAKSIIKQISAGNNTCTLNIDAQLEIGRGTTYNVMGMIPGKNHENHIIISGHYDKYWLGFQDDCAAIGLVFTIAKAMLHANYQPQNDIYFICHGAEEWGVSNSQFDWATGAWGFCQQNQDFCDQTLLMLNCELPGYTRDDGVIIAIDTELQTMVLDVLDKNIVLTSGDMKINKNLGELSTYEDGIAYKASGVPHFYDCMTGQSWMKSNYHTMSDSLDSLDVDTLNTMINMYAAYAIYVDKTPALNYDFTCTVDYLKEQFVESSAKLAGVDTKQYELTLENLQEVATDAERKIYECNKNYEKAYKEKDEKAMDDAIKEGSALNKKNREAFKIIQDEIFKIHDGFIYYGHPYADESLEMIDNSIKYLNEGDVLGNKIDVGAAPAVGLLNAGHEYYYSMFSRENAHRNINMYPGDPNQTEVEVQWARGKIDPVIDIEDAVIELIRAKDINNIKDINAVMACLENGRTQSLNLIAKNCREEISALNKVIQCLKS